MSIGFITPTFNIESIYDIDIISLKKMDINALFFDLDSTIMKSKSGKFSYRTLQFLNDLQANFKIAIVTNNSNVDYINEVKSQIDIPVYYGAKKPNIAALLRACRELNVPARNCAMVGDRPLSDILGGQKAGMATILVDSISKEEENKIVRFARFIERLAIKN